MQILHQGKADSMRKKSAESAFFSNWSLLNIRQSSSCHEHPARQLDTTPMMALEDARRPAISKLIYNNCYLNQY
jgi:hypothetical protein